MRALTLEQKAWLYDHPEFQFAGPPRMVTFTESGTLYADGLYEKHTGNDVIRLTAGPSSTGPVAVAIYAETDTRRPGEAAVELIGRARWKASHVPSRVVSDLLKELATFIEAAEAKVASLTADLKSANEALREAEEGRTRLARELERADTEIKRLTARRGETATEWLRRYTTGLEGEFTAGDVGAASPDAFSTEQVYNALTYLSRTGELERLGYGRYRAARSLQQGDAP